VIPAQAATWHDFHLGGSEVQAAEQEIGRRRDNFEVMIRTVVDRVTPLERAGASAMPAGVVLR
jgi:hypothetical protein